jgi:CheY-like chemotaxis protein
MTPQSLLIPSLTGNILLVEDSELNQELVTHNLLQTGVQVDWAMNGLEGLQKMLTGQYDLVLMDIQMPVMDGKEAMKSLQQLGISTPVYALTANVMPLDIQEYATIGFTGTLSKPLELRNLYNVLNQHLATCDDKVNHECKASQLTVQDPKLKSMFYIELAKQHIEITKCIHNVDCASLIKIMHIIKGSAGSFGHNDLTNLAAESLLLLRTKQYREGVEQCTNLNLKVAEVLNDNNNQHTISR